MDEKILKRRIEKKATLLQAMKQMDKERVKLLFIFDKENFIGIFTIGDIQRAILSKVSLNSHIYNHIDINKEYSFPNESLVDVKKKMIEMRTECMPIIDSKGQLIGAYFWEDIFGENQVPCFGKIDIPVVIMAGGKGTRLKPLTNIIPKPLLPIGDKTILEIILDKFTQAGCSKFYMSVNYKSGFLKYYLENIPINYDIIFFEENEPLGTIGSVSLLKDKITTPFFVSNCDILIEQDFREVYNYHVTNKNDITIVTAIKTHQIPYGVIEAGEYGLMTKLTEKPEFNYMINTGVYILQPDVINEIPHGKFYHITDLIDKIRKNGGHVGCFPISEKSWIDIGEWNEYLKLIR
ncbi:D-glycero-alpha-D-manno-heptose 1-phosphate guanylyltransferase [termite gut metagenome]|uniref:D-glycero-alpha-D-manno-heptose 1-phosphate guanylyltransferase n=1 Tax=termite gut metagenome TaxID=433724 RepID=A0A5J4RL81_9ZZZZ